MVQKARGKAQRKSGSDEQTGAVEVSEISGVAFVILHRLWWAAVARLARGGPPAGLQPRRRGIQPPQQHPSHRVHQFRIVGQHEVHRGARAGPDAQCDRGVRANHGQDRIGVARTVNWCRRHPYPMLGGARLQRGADDTEDGGRIGDRRQAGQQRPADRRVRARGQHYNRRPGTRRRESR